MVSPSVSRTLRFMAGIPDEDQPDFASSRPFTDNSLPFDARDIDGGPREAPPVPAGVPTVGVSPTIHDSRQTDEGPREYRPPAPVYADPTIADPSYSEQRQPDPIMGPEQPEATLESTVSDALAGPLRAAGEAAREAYNDPFFAAAPQPPRWVKIVSDAMQAFGGKVARQVAESLGVTDEEWFSVFGYPISRLDVAEFAGGVAADPTNYVGLNLADPLLTVARGAARDFVPDAIQQGARAAGSTLREGAEAVGRGLGEAAQGAGTFVRDIAEEAAYQATFGPRSMARNVIEPTGNGMPLPRTVEALQDELNGVRSLIERARQASDAALEKRAIDRAWELESALVDARNARRDLEPRIVSDVGRRIETLPMDERTADDLAGLGRERVAPEAAADITRPSAVATDMQGRMNAAIPGFDPASAAVGASAGITGDEEEPVDPLQTGAGMLIAGIAGNVAKKRGALVPTNSPVNPRRLAAGIQQAAAKGTPPPQAGQVPGFPTPPPQAPPSWWERVQAWRYSVGLFGQISTGLLQGAGGLAEVATGAPAELIRQAILRGHPEHVPLIIGEALKSIPAGARSAVETVRGRVPQAILNSSDYRPPVSQRETTALGQGIMNAVEAPGRIATQAPDAFWYEVFYRTGLAQAAAEEAQRQGASRLNPVASARMQRQLIANPTPEVIARAHEFAQSSTYKGDLGAIGQIGEMVVKGPSADMLAGANPKVQAVGKVYREIMSHFMPVYHTVARIHEGALEYVPGVGMLPLNRMGLADKGRPLDQKIAQQAVGLSMTAAALAYAAQGGIRGPGHPDPDVNAEMRDMGRENNTVNVGGLWVPTMAFGKLGPILNAVGALNDAMIYGSGSQSWEDMKENDPWFRKRIEVLTKNFGRAFEDYPTASAFAAIAKLGKDPVAAVSELLGDTASQYSPAAVRAYATSQDPKARRPDRADDAGPLELATDRFKQRSGIGRQSLPVAQDRLGREVENTRQGWAALFPRTGADKPDPVIQAFVDSKVEIPRKREKVTIDGLEIPLTPPLQRKWQQYMGEYLLKEVPRTTRSQFWNRPTTTIGDRADELRDLVKEATEDATDRLEGDIGKDRLKQLLREAERAEMKKRGEPVPAGR